MSGEISHSSFSKTVALSKTSTHIANARCIRTHRLFSAAEKYCRNIKSFYSKEIDNLTITIFRMEKVDLLLQQFQITTTIPVVMMIQKSLLK